MSIHCSTFAGLWRSYGAWRQLQGLTYEQDVAYQAVVLLKLSGRSTATGCNARQGIPGLHHHPGATSRGYLVRGWRRSRLLINRRWTGNAQDLPHDDEIFLQVIGSH